MGIEEVEVERFVDDEDVVVIEFLIFVVEDVVLYLYGVVFVDGKVLVLDFGIDIELFDDGNDDVVIDVLLIVVLI